MWVYDGEEWSEEGATTDKGKPESIAIRIEEYMPELQIVEIIQTPQTNRVPPFPLP